MATKKPVFDQSNKFHSEKSRHALSQFKNARPFKPSGKKPINRPK